MSNELTPELALAKTITTADARRMILETIMGVKNKTVGIGEAQTILGGMKILNENLMTEINAAKLQIQIAQANKTRVDVANMGQLVITGEKA